MKKFNILVNTLIWLSLALWLIKALLDYNNYTRHVELYAAHGWVWYADVLAWGKCVLPIVVICLVVKYIFRKKYNKSNLTNRILMK